MVVYGLTAAGFVKKPFDVCYQQARDTLRAAFGQGANVDDPSGPLGQIAGIMADRESELWDAMEVLYVSRDPDQSEGSALDAICTLTGTQRLPPMRSAVYVTLTGTPGTLIPAGVVASVVGTGVRFVQLDAATIGAGGTSTLIRYAAEEAGALAAPAGTLTQIETPVSGWDAIANETDATLGSDVESDADLRLRRVQGLASSGVSTLDAVRAAVLRRSGVTACTVFENTTLVTDTNNLPAKAIEVLVQGGDDQDIYTTIWKTKPAGIETYGGQSGTVVDSLGLSHTVAFTRPVPRPIYVAVVLRIGAGWPADGVAQVIAALVDWGQSNLHIDTDVVSYQLKMALQLIPGITDIPAVFIGTTPQPTSEATLVIPAREQAQIDSTRITVAIP